MLALRIKYKKEGKAKYISHLDVIRCFQRGLRRAGISVYHTQGFNPHPHIVFALPIPLFFESDCEICDIKINDELTTTQVQEKLIGNLPEGITVIQVTEPLMKLSDAAYAEYSLTLEYDLKDTEELKEMIVSVISNEKVNVERNSKRGIISVDVKEYLENCKFSFENAKINVHVTLPAGSSLNISPLLLVTAIENYGLAPDISHIKRLCIYNSSMEPFI